MDKYISTEDIYSFLLNENEQKRKDINEYYMLPVEERVKKRKCIAGLRFDVKFSEYNRNKGHLFRFTFDKNISDFKVGDYVLLTKNAPIGWEKVRGMGSPIVEIGSNYVILAKVVNSSIIDTNSEYTIDSWYFDSSDINNSFIVSNNERKEQWLSVINEIPSLKFGEFPQLESLLLELCESLNVELTSSQHRAIIEAVSNQEYSLIQGPPGTGKTFVIAIIAILLLMYQNRVLISSPNHMAINNVLCKIHKSIAQRYDLDPKKYKVTPSEENQSPINTLHLPVFKIGQEYQTDGLNYEFKGEEISVQNLPYPNVNVFAKEGESNINRWIIGVTPQTLYTRASGLEADVLIIDEAGQMTIPTALMATQKADYVVLVGDHKQLPPICSYKEHPEFLQQSIFQALYRDYNCVTLDQSYRMNAQICQLVSDSFYDGTLQSKFPNRTLAQHDDEYLLINSQSVFFKDILHMGTCSSEEEAEYIAGLIDEYINRHHVSTDQIAVIAPFRAQCALIRRKLYALMDEIPVVETIDRMQGQERDIIFFSFTAGNCDYASDLVDFLYNANKINVAVSRARCKLFMVGNKSCILSSIGKSEHPDKFNSLINLLEHPLVQPL